MNKPQDKTILVVDDEPDVITFLQTALEDVGYNVMTASNGDEALECIKQHQPDFISIDLVMPRKSGIRLIHELRRNKDWAKIPFIVVTGHARDEHYRHSLDDIIADKQFSGTKIYLEKPVKAHEFVNHVSAELGVTLTVENLAETNLKSMKNEIEGMIDATDPETLKQVLDLLKKKQ